MRFPLFAALVCIAANCRRKVASRAVQSGRPRSTAATATAACVCRRGPWNATFVAPYPWEVVIARKGHGLCLVRRAVARMKAGTCFKQTSTDVCVVLAIPKSLPQNRIVNDRDMEHVCGTNVCFLGPSLLQIQGTACGNPGYVNHFPMCVVDESCKDKFSLGGLHLARCATYTSFTTKGCRCKRHRNGWTFKSDSLGQPLATSLVYKCVCVSFVSKKKPAADEP